MRLEINIPEHHYNNIMAFDSVSLGRVPYKGIIMYAINAIKHGRVLEQEPTTRNCFGCKYSKNNHIAGTEECHLCMWENQYTPTTKNDLGVDCVARQDVERYIEGFINEYTPKEELEFINLELDGLKHIPSVTPQFSSKLEKNSKKLEKDFGELDYISREQALVAIRNLYPSMPRVDFNGSLRKWVDKYKPYIECEDAIEELSSVTPQEPKWIPNSERLPKKTGRYLITYCYQDKIETQEAVYVEDEEETKWYDTTEIEITLAVIAWMPLPEPYEPQESEEE